MAPKLLLTLLVAAAVLAGCLQPHAGSPARDHPPLPAGTSAPPTATPSPRPASPAAPSANATPDKLVVYQWSGTLTGVSVDRALGSAPPVRGAPGPEKEDPFTIPAGYHHWSFAGRLDLHGYFRLEVHDGKGDVVLHGQGAVTPGYFVGLQLEGIDDAGGDWSSTAPGNYTLCYYIDGTSGFQDMQVIALR
jgi:hypothetical protein